MALWTKRTIYELVITVSSRLRKDKFQNARSWDIKTSNRHILRFTLPEWASKLG